MKYRNTRTGCEIDTACVISGGSWEPVEGEAAQEPDDRDIVVRGFEVPTEAAKPAARKKTAKTAAKT